MTDDRGPPRDPAAARYWILQLARLAGLAMALAGVGILGGRIDAPAPLGPVLLVAGLADFFLVPLFLARRWKRGA